MLTVGSLFAGIGGFDLGLERAGMKVIWQSEIDPYASAVLKKHWPDIPNHGDIRTIRAGNVERPDVLCGGFPCQDISSSGMRLGINGNKSGLWVEYARLICQLRPRFVIVENVADLLFRGLGRVLGDLAAVGYDAEWRCVGSERFGIPQARERVWIVAYPSEGGQPTGNERITTREEVVRWPDDDRLDEAQSVAQACAAATFRNDDGIPRWMERTAALGNAVHPRIAEIIGRAIIAAEG